MNFIKKVTDNIKNSNNINLIIVAIGVLVVLLAVFKIGIYVGYRKAQFSYRWGENYHRNFAGPRNGFFNRIDDNLGYENFTNGHGSFGSILKIDNDTLVIQGKDNFEKTILTTSSTKIIGRNNSSRINALKVDDRVVVIGTPNDQGQIEGKLIRIFN